jgi:FAD/FMN-containing dehydrogenase
LSREQAELLSGVFAEFQPSLVEGALTDFSGFRSHGSPCCEVAPRGADTVARIVQLAYERHVTVRTRAQAHSLNGSSLPAAAELLLSTRNIRHVSFEEPGTVTVGSGVVLWILQHILRRHGFDIPVLNDGYPGPSVGGYIAAGGFGPRSAEFGGFWDNILEIRLVDGCGNLRRVAAGDPLFLWLFGSMGQLGVFADAKLTIIPLSASGPATYPAGTTLVAPRLVAPKVPPQYATEGQERLFWFTLFTPDEHLDEAHRDLSALESRHSAALRFQERYRYPILPRGKVAPLVYPYARPFTATGAWGWLTDSRPNGLAALHEFDREFMVLAAANAHYRRYVQSELPSGPEIYRRCFGEQTYQSLQDLKLQLDPGSLLNRGSVFA